MQKDMLNANSYPGIREYTIEEIDCGKPFEEKREKKQQITGKLSTFK